METKRTVTVDLMGQKIAVRTTEPEETLEQNIARVQDALLRIKSQTGSVDTVRLFALGLLHLGRELNVLEHRYKELCDQIDTRLEVWTNQVRTSAAS